MGPDNRVLYVGQAKDLRQRWSGHHRKQQARGVRGAQLAYVLCDAADLTALEKEYIGHVNLMERPADTLSAGGAP